MRIIGIVRNKKDVELFGDLKLGDTTIRELWLDDVEEYEQPYFPAVIYQLEDDDDILLFNIYSMHKIKSGEWKMLSAVEFDLLTKVLDNAIPWTIYSPIDKIINAINLDNITNAKDLLKVTISTYNKYILRFDSIKTKFNYLGMSKCEDGVVRMLVELLAYKQVNSKDRITWSKLITIKCDNCMENKEGMKYVVRRVIRNLNDCVFYLKKDE